MLLPVDKIAKRDKYFCSIRR